MSVKEKPFVSLVLPAYNEEKAIQWAIDKAREALDAHGYHYEILVVDDASTDRTAELAESRGVRVVRRRVNQGSGASRKTGILSARGEIIAMLDADGTYDPGDLPGLLEQMDRYDMINGVRAREMGTLKLLRAPAKFLIRKLAEYLSGHKIADLNTGMKVFRKDIMLRYLWVIPDGFSCVTSMTLAFLTNGYPVGFLPINYYARIGRSKFHPVKDTLKYVQAVLRLVIYFNPMKFFAPLSLGLFLFGLTKTLYDYFFVLRRMQLSDIVIILASFIFFVIGLLSDLIVAQSRQISHLYASMVENREKGSE
jgi:glycosyltransferase involved in cell wall biosynthesis